MRPENRFSGEKPGPRYVVLVFFLLFTNIRSKFNLINFTQANDRNQIFLVGMKKCMNQLMTKQFIRAMKQEMTILSSLVIFLNWFVKTLA